MESVLILCDKGPFGTNAAIEAIRIGAGFVALGEDVECKLVLYGDGVLFMNKNLDNTIIGMDPLDDGLEMADLSGLPIAVVKEDMDARGMSEEDLLEYEDLEVISMADIPNILSQFETCFKM